MNRRNERRGARAFTLVELVTVMGILAILVALIVGAAQGVSDLAARKATERMLASLEGALQRYYDDWGKFPWYRDENAPDLAELLGKVAGAGTDPMARRAKPNYCPIPMAFWNRCENGVEAILFATLTMRERNGPYMLGGGENVKVLPFGPNYRYQVYVDAWGRPIHYFQPQEDSSGNLRPMPLLMSEGRMADIFDHVTRQGDTWPEGSKADNLTNYDLHAMGINRLQYTDSSRKY